MDFVQLLSVIRSLLVFLHFELVHLRFEFSCEKNKVLFESAEYYFNGHYISLSFSDEISGHLPFTSLLTLFSLLHGRPRTHEAFPFCVQYYSLLNRRCNG